MTSNGSGIAVSSTIPTTSAAERVEQTVAAIVDNGPAPRPAWQTAPCPVWCDNLHRDDDYTADRVHAAQLAPVALSLYDDDRAGEGSRPGELRIDVEQHYRQAEADVALVMPEHKLSDSQVTGETDLMLTVAETRALRDRLSAVLALVDAAAHDALDAELAADPDDTALRSVEHSVRVGEFCSDVTIASNLLQWTDPDADHQVEVEVHVADNVACFSPAQAHDAARQLREAAARIDALAERAEAANSRIGAGQ